MRSQNAANAAQANVVLLPLFSGKIQRVQTSVLFSNDNRSTSQRARSAYQDLLIEFLIYDLDRAVDLGIGHTELMRNQLYQQIDPLDERRSSSYRAGSR